MPHSIPPLDDDVFEALQELAEPLVDDTNSVLRRLLGISTNGSTPQPTGASAGTESQAEAKKPSASVRARPTQKRVRARKPAVTPKRPRAARGSLLPAADYELPILRYLAENGGRAPASEVVDAVGVALDDRFTAVDKDEIDSGEIRWKSRVQFVRLHLIKMGYMTREAPRGMWAITQQGQRRIEESV
jgi:hypothetical protein